MLASRRTLAFVLFLFGILGLMAQGQVVITDDAHVVKGYPLQILPTTSLKGEGR